MALFEPKSLALLLRNGWHYLNRNSQVPTTKNVQANEKSLVEIPSGLEKGYQFILEPGVAVGVDYNEVEMAKIDVVNGIRFNPYIALGLGTGIRSYNEVLAVPIFLDLRVNFIKTRVSPYLSLGLGYSLALDETELGAFAQPAIGISYRIGKATAMHIGLSLIAQSFTEESVYSNYNYYYGTTTYDSQSYDEVLYSVGLNVGFSF